MYPKITVFLLSLFPWLFIVPVSVAVDPANRILSFDNGLAMELLEESGQFLGIGEVRFNGKCLRTGQSPVFPLVAADWSFPQGLYSGLRLAEVKSIPNGWELVIELHERVDPIDWEKAFLINEGGTIDRDLYFFARTAVPDPGDCEGVIPLDAGAKARSAELPPAGFLRWRIESVEENIAGWPWTGWRWSFSGEIEDGVPLNSFRLLSGWAIDGTIDGLTLANQRYRGLGFPAQTFHDSGKGSGTSWNTQDLQLPSGWEGRSAETDRKTAANLRNSASIHAPARGAGTGFIDYQYRTTAALAAFPERQGNLRALTEIYPGDRVPSQLDEEYFEATRSWRTTPHRYLFLATDEPQPRNFWQTRYLELEQRVRSAVREELGFVETPVLPTVGALFDFWKPGDGFAQVVARLGAHAGRWSELGVRRIMVHNPGWKNGRAAQREWDGARRDEFVGGSVNTVYDWWPLPDVESAWRETHAALQQLGIEYYVWITGMTHRDAGFHHFVGDDPSAWASNTPDGRPTPIYGEETLKHNMLNDRFRNAFDERLDGVRREFGYEGFWGDSFQNLFMSQMDWIGHDGMPQQRAWWEWVSGKTREGIGWIAESQSFPGLSCSIETDGWDRHPWLLGHTIKWLRGHAQLERSPERWMPLAYKLMAYNAWLAPETWLYEVNRETQPDSVIAEFGRLANEFLAARTDMDRPYILPDGSGVLWMPYREDDRGVLFPFKRMQLPEGVTGRGVLDTNPAQTRRAKPWKTLTLEGNSLLKAFGLPEPPMRDSRKPATGTHLEIAGSIITDHPPALTFQPIPGRNKKTPWNTDLPIWKEMNRDDSIPWPEDGKARAYFPPHNRMTLHIDGHLTAAGIQTVTPGIQFVINTGPDVEAPDLLELNGPLLGPCTVYFKGTLKEDGWPHTPMRARTGLQFRGGGVYDLEADLLPWPENRNFHSQVVGLDDPGTTVHFRGTWDATGELCRPGLVLGDDTRFVVWPEAHLDFVKNYGGYTLQLWVTGTGERGGVLEFHPDFVADRSRIHISTTEPKASDLVPDAIGSIRIGGATLITHDSRNLPMTGRSMHDETDSIQNNGHLVFEYRGTNRWIVRSRDQLYRGAVWIDHDLEILTGKNLVLEGVTEPPDLKYHYTAANAFQTRHKRNSPERITIRKSGPASLILRGEQAYVEESVMCVEEGSVEFCTNPAAGRTFPHGEPQSGINLELCVDPEGTVVWSASEVQLESLVSTAGADLVWTVPCLVTVETPTRLNGTPIWRGPPVESSHVLLVAPWIDVGEDALPEGWSLRKASGKMELVYHPTSFNP